MDLAAAARDGISFFTHKATEGVSTKHKSYGEAMRRARDAGIPVLGAYHVVRSSPSVASQVDYMVAYMDSATPWWRTWRDWFIQVDLEKWSYDTVPARVGEEFADLVEARTGRKAVIYASRGQYGSDLTGTSHELWNANYGTNIEDHYQAVYAARGGDSGPGWVTYSGRMPKFWQYGSRTRIGTQHICDANAFRGTLAELRALISTASTSGGGMECMFDGPKQSALAEMYNLTGSAPFSVTMNKLAADVAELLARPPVQAAPVDEAALKAVLLDEEVLTAIAKAVVAEQARELTD